MLEPAWAAALLFLGFILGLYPGWKALKARQTCATCGDFAAVSVCLRCREKGGEGRPQGLMHEPGCGEVCNTACPIGKLIEASTATLRHELEEEHRKRTSEADAYLKDLGSLYNMIVVHYHTSGAPSLSRVGFIREIKNKILKLQEPIDKVMSDLVWIYNILHKEQVASGDLDAYALQSAIRAKLLPTPEKGVRTLYSLNFTATEAKPQTHVVMPDEAIGRGVVLLTMTWRSQSDSPAHLNATVERNHRGEIVATFTPKN